MNEPLYKKAARFYAHPETCPNSAAHTDGPEEHVAWLEWAKAQRKTHHQKRCGGCGLWTIWERR